MADALDVIISGGGLVGATTAYALAQSGLRIALVEARHPPRSGTRPHDPRVTALSDVSRTFFQALGLWPRLAAHTGSIRSIHVSDACGSGVCRMHAADIGRDALGHVIENDFLLDALWQQVCCHPAIEIVAPASIESVRIDSHNIRVKLKGKTAPLQARLLIGADGAQSATRALFGIAAPEYDYRQTAVLATVQTSNPQSEWAYERFTANGPMALLPLTSNVEQRRYALIWCMPPDMAAQTTALSPPEFCDRLRAQFGHRLGRFTLLSERIPFPLRYQEAARAYAPRSLFIGNAAHSLHPVAGQGFNLSLREVARTVETIGGAYRREEDIGATALLQKLAAHCHNDIQQTGLATHYLVLAFSQNLPGWTLLRNAGLLGFDHSMVCKNWLTRRAMGGWPLPLLSRGVPLTYRMY